MVWHTWVCVCLDAHSLCFLRNTCVKTTKIATYHQLYPAYPAEATTHDVLMRHFENKKPVSWAPGKVPSSVLQVVLLVSLGLPRHYTLTFLLLSHRCWDWQKYLPKISFNDVKIERSNWTGISYCKRFSRHNLQVQDVSWELMLHCM